MMLFGLNQMVSTEHVSIFSTFSSAFLSNALALTGAIYYYYLMFRGYGILPFIRKPSNFLIPVPVIAITLILMTLMRINSWNVLLKFTVI